MIYADVETINRFERRGIEHGNDCVIGIRCGINHPQSVVVHVEVDDVVLGGVQIVGVVGRGEIELLHACVVWLINCHLRAQSSEVVCYVGREILRLSLTCLLVKR